MFYASIFSQREQTNMTDAQRIELLEKALIKYVEIYGFINEARDYYISVGQACIGARN